MLPGPPECSKLLFFSFPLSVSFYSSEAALAKAMFEETLKVFFNLKHFMTYLQTKYLS